LARVAPPSRPWGEGPAATMPPKAKPAAKGKAAAGRAAAKPAPVPSPPAPEEAKAPALSVPEAEAGIEEVSEEAWAELADCEESPSEVVAGVLKALLLLLGEPEASSWQVAHAALADRPALLRELRALGSWGCSEGQLARAAEALKAADWTKLRRPPAAGSGASAAKSLQSAKAPAAKAKAAPALAPIKGAEAALAVGLMAEALLEVRRGDEKPPGFPDSWPTDPLRRLHDRLRIAAFGKMSATVVCPSIAALAAATLYCERLGAVMCDVAQLQVQVGLTKTMGANEASAIMAGHLKEALTSGRPLVLMLGAAPPDLNKLCGSGPAGFPVEALWAEKIQEVAKAMGLSGLPASGFQIVLLVELSKAKAEQLMPKHVPGFDDMAVLVLDEKSLPAASDLASLQATKPSLRAATLLLALPPAEEFEYVESFGEDYLTRWSMGPATKDEHGKEIRQNLIQATVVKYPANPKDAKMCLQLVGGAANSPCTGLWTSFSPLARPTEVEFEFTMNGKVDLPNACVVFTEKPWQGALPDCKIGVQFAVRGGMQLCGGAGNLVRISNDGKIQNDKWNKVLLKIDWKDKVIVGQVDTKGKGYAPAIQTVPFRDQTCEGFGYLYIYNTDMQGTCWFSSLRIKQAFGDAFAGLGTDGLQARAVLAKRLQQREYERAVNADMEVGMKMGAIKCTKEHGMNLAEEQRANNSSFM